MNRTPLRSHSATLPLLLALSAGAANCGPSEAPAPREMPPATAEAHEQHPPLPRTPLTQAPMARDEWRGQERCTEERCAAPAVPGALPRHRAAIALTGKRTRGANTQLAMPNNLLLADIDADGSSDFLQFASNKIFVSRTDFQKTGLLHLYLDRPVRRVLTGDFHADGYDQTCAVLDTGALKCFGISTDRRELWWWFTQGTIVGDDEDAVVADFNGDRRDDVLVYNRGSGQLRMYTLQGDFFFHPMPGFSLGNLSGVAAPGMQLRAGDFNGDGRDDVMVVNPARQVLYYASVHDGANHTFWWAFTTSGGFVGANDQVSVARIDDNASDDVVLRDRVSGATRFYRMEYQAGVLPAITGVSLGQLAVRANSLLFWGAMHGALAEPGAAYRDDAMVFDLGPAMFIRSDARWDGSRYTYWWAYTQYAPNNHTGWAPFEAKPWLVLKCKFADRSAEPQTNDFFRRLYTTAGSGSVVDYFRDVSYGSWDMTGNRVIDAWYTMDVTVEQARPLSRYQKTQRCVNAYGGSLAGYVNAVTVVNEFIDAGFHGRVLADPGAWNVTFTAHEMGHGFGYGHSFDDTTRRAADWSAPGEYFDLWDIMSAMNVHTFSNPQGLTAGPEMNAPYKTRSGWIPAHRLTRLVPAGTRQSARLSLASINRPEASGPLMVRIGSNDNDYHTVEYRMRSGWDQGIPRDAVLVHRVRGGVSYLITAGGTERLPGSVYTFAPGFTLRVHGLAAQGYTADVTVEY